ncbi:hypothetical protein BKA70DRAFT_1443886 [Coprinopsis sp. MPI-PUGE-AT-0042]|nr:hypothetical protein BKA70DRAFT_1443886 [Coprinopsis sp. MPI-PUGE-AT-0042]
MGNVASRASAGLSLSNPTVSGNEQSVEPHAAGQRQGSRSSSLETSSTSEAPSFMRGVSNSQVTVGPVTVAGRDSISSTIIQYFPSFPQDPWSGSQVSEILDWLSSINFRACCFDI